MVSVYGPDSGQTYGLLSDISEAGAQFVAGVLFDTKSRILLRIGFNPEEPFSTPAEVVRTSDGGAAKHEPNYSHEVRFRFEDPEQRQRLRTLLESPEFARLRKPGASRQAAGLSNAIRDLADEVADLGDRTRNES
jgi:hypothetical protein